MLSRSADSHLDIPIEHLLCPRVCRKRGSGFRQAGATVPGKLCCRDLVGQGKVREVHCVNEQHPSHGEGGRGRSC